MKIKNLLQNLSQLDPEAQFVLFDNKEVHFYRISELPIETGLKKYIIGIEKIEKPEWF